MTVCVRRMGIVRERTGLLLLGRRGMGQGVEVFTELAVQHNTSVAQGAPTPLDESAGLTLNNHPNDPFGQGIATRPGKGPEFLITITVTVPAGTPQPVVDEATTREAGRTRDLAARGHLWRLWTLPAGPDGPRTLGLWRARDPGELMAIVESLPLSGWMTIETTPLSPHPNDPIRLL